MTVFSRFSPCPKYFFSKKRMFFFRLNFLLKLFLPFSNENKENVLNENIALKHKMRVSMCFVWFNHWTVMINDHSLFHRLCAIRFLSFMYYVFVVCVSVCVCVFSVCVGCWCIGMWFIYFFFFFSSLPWISQN